MLYLKYVLTAHKSKFANSLAVIGLLTLPFFPVSGQSFLRELDTPDRVSVSVKNLSGRVEIVAAETQKNKVAIEASSRGTPVDSSDVVIEPKGASISIDVRDRGEKNRIDLIQHQRFSARKKIVITIVKLKGIRSCSHVGQTVE